MYRTSKPDLSRLIRIARKLEPADLTLKNGRIINVLSHEILKADIAISQGVIAAVGEDYEGIECIDLKGKAVSPGFIDGHVHVESSMVPIHEFARTIVPKGTTTIIIDPHEITNIMGTSGISYMLKTSKYNPLNVFIMLPSCVPATPFETSGAELKAIDLFPMLQDKWVLGLGEMMNYPGVLGQHEDVLDKIKISEGMIIDGHAPGLSGSDLNAYIAAGMRSDHECTTTDEAREKLRLGMHIMMRQGSSTKNLLDLLPLVSIQNLDRFMFVTDDCSPEELLEDGHIDRMIRTSIEWGLDPVSAYRLATINAARYFGLSNIGAIAPGYEADCVILDDLEKVRIHSVFKNGIQVSKQSEAIYPQVDHSKILMRGSINVKWIEKEHFLIPARGKSIRVIKIIPGQIVTQCEIEPNPVIRNGFLESDPGNDLLKLVVIERHFGSGRTGLGMIRGMGLKKGAIASTIAHDSHNIIAAGANDDDIFAAVVQLVRQQGGLALALDGQIIASLPLPIGGLMTELPLDQVRAKLDEMIGLMKSMGCTMEHPFMSLSFMSLPVIPQIKLTDNGLFDVTTFNHVDLFVDQ